MHKSSTDAHIVCTDAFILFILIEIKYVLQHTTEVHYISY